MRGAACAPRSIEELRDAEFESRYHGGYGQDDALREAAKAVCDAGHGQWRIVADMRP